VSARVRGRLPATSRATASGTAGSTSQVTGVAPAAAPSSTSERSRPSTSSSDAHRSSERSRPSGVWRIARRTGITIEARSEPRVLGGTSDRNVRARPSAKLSGTSAESEPRACAPNQ
jgi:hypothetical protein